MSPAHRDVAQDALRVKVRALMAQQDRNQAALARVLHRSTGWVSNWLSGKIRRANVTDVETLARFFDVPVTELLTVTSPVTATAEADAGGVTLTADELWVVVNYRKLTPSAQKRVRRVLLELNLEAEAEDHTRQRAAR